VTDPGLVAKKLAFIETCVRELRDLARPEQIDHDVRERRLVEHTLHEPTTNYFVCSQMRGG
jgi:hypothetical protein